MKFALASVLAQLLILANGQNISYPSEIGQDVVQQDAELKYRILKEEFSEQLRSLKLEMNLRTSALYKIVTNIELTLLKQGLTIEKVTKGPADFYDQSEDIFSKLLSLERKVEKEVNTMRSHDARLVQRLSILESEVKANSTKFETHVLSVDSMTAKNDSILQAVETLKNETVSLKKENLALNNKIDKITKDQSLTQTKSAYLRTSEILFSNDKSMNSSIAIMNETLAQLKTWCLKENNNQKQKRSADLMVLSDEELTKLKSLVQQVGDPGAWFRDIHRTLRVLKRETFKLTRNLSFASSEINTLKLNISQLPRENCFDLNDVKTNVTKIEQKVSYLTSFSRNLQEDLLSVQNLSSMIWHQCNETKEQVVHLSKLATVLNVSLTTHQEDVFLNLTLQEYRLNNTIAEKLHLITTNISNVKNTSDRVQNSLHSIESEIQKNTKYISESQSELFNLALEFNNKNVQLADVKTKQLIIESNLLRISTKVHEFRLAANNSIDECKTFTRTHVTELEEQIKSINKNLMEYDNDLDSSMISLQNLTRDIASLREIQRHTEKKYSNFEGNVSVILQTTKTFETDVANLRRRLNDLNTNATANQMTVQTLMSTSVKIQEDLSSTQSLSSIIWDQCNRTKQQLVNTSKMVTEMRISNKDRQEVLEQKILAIQENASSFRASVANEAENVDKLKRGIQSLQQNVFHNLTQQNIQFATMVEEKIQLLATNISNMKNSSDQVQWLLHALQSDMQHNTQNIRMCQTEIIKLASEQNKTNVQLIDAKNIQRTIQSDLSMISTSVNGFQLAVNHSVKECKKFTVNYVYVLEKHIQMIENNFSEFQGDLNEVMLSVQNHSYEITSLYKSQKLHVERLTKFQENLSAIACTTNHFEMVLSNLSVLNDVITNVTFNTKNIQDLRSSSFNLQHNLSSFHALSSAIWRQCNSTEEWIQNISSIVKTNPLVEKEIMKLQYNVTTLAVNFELVSNETRDNLDEQAQRLLVVTSKLEKNAIQMTNTSDDLKQTLRNNQLFMTSLINNVSNHEGRLAQMSAALNRSTELINSIKHNITSLSDSIRDVSTVAVKTTTESTSQNLVRLVGGSSDREGRVEVFHGGDWGTVCDDSWDSTDATVVCRMLGYTGSASAFERARFGSGTGRIILDEVRCSGVESSIFSCPHNGIDQHDCSHSEDAAVSCS